MIIQNNSHDIASVYLFLAQSMKYPDQAWMNEDFFMVFYTLLQNLDAEQEAARIKEIIRQADDALEDLQIEYTRLFINGVPHVVAPPYGSVYMDKSFQGKFAGDTLAFYREKGFDMNQESDLPDHLIHELEFLSLLTSEEDFEGEQLFLRKFFRPWYQQFQKRVSEETHHPYYRVVAQLIDFFTKEEDEDGFQLNQA